MITYAEAELIQDKTVMRAIRRAEEKTGMKTGMRFLEERPVKVSVTFYPKIQFWVQGLDDMNKVVTAPQRLSAEGYAETRGLLL